MDTAVRKVSIAEHARHAAQLAATTFQHQENPHELGSTEHAEWAAAYQRYFDECISGEGSA
jgi:hypothetical protein